MDTAERTTAVETKTSTRPFLPRRRAVGPSVAGGIAAVHKPRWKRRPYACSETNPLSANAHLLSSITDVGWVDLWFVLLLSPQAAKSHPVNHESNTEKRSEDLTRIASEWDLDVSAQWLLGVMGDDDPHPPRTALPASNRQDCHFPGFGDGKSLSRTCSSRIQRKQIGDRITGNLGDDQCGVQSGPAVDSGGNQHQSRF